FPETKVALDIWHFLMRYSACVIGTSKNPRQKEVVASISSCVLAQKAEGTSQHAKYWSKEEQEQRLVQTFERFEKEGGIWAPNASKVHAEQLRHVQLGCLTRPRDDIASDGSRIEGSHKGWNSLNRAQPSGLETISALCHDYVLRRNVRIASRLEDRPAFLRSTFGSHHVHLVDYVAKLWNQTCQEAKSDDLAHLPTLPKVDSGESFGLVPSHHFLSFGGNIEVKVEECLELDLINTKVEDVKDILAGASTPLPNVVVPSGISQKGQHHSQHILMPTILTCCEACLDGTSANSFTFPLEPAPSLPPRLLESLATALPRLPPGLTRSEHFFSISTGIDARALRISVDAEFYLFMDMRDQFKWQSYNMSPKKWVPATDTYNRRLRQLNLAKGLPTIDKHPQALLRKLGEIERSVLDRINAKNFKCASHLSDMLLGNWY
ncbi:hypothetical protein CONPUDRAFT_64946, partial [Coniophora puteana RWD-64-598 SS2]